MALFDRPKGLSLVWCLRDEWSSAAKFHYRMASRQTLATYSFTLWLFYVPRHTVYIQRAVKLSQWSCLFESILNQIKTNRTRSSSEAYIWWWRFLIIVADSSIGYWYKGKFCASILHSNMLSRHMSCELDKIHMDSTCVKLKLVFFLHSTELTMLINMAFPFYAECWFIWLFPFNKKKQHSPLASDTYLDLRGKPSKLKHTKRKETKNEMCSNIAAHTVSLSWRTSSQAGPMR